MSNNSQKAPEVVNPRASETHTLISELLASKENSSLIYKKALFKPTSSRVPRTLLWCASIRS